jgi:branched-chain amino acid transport system substrate-binding protein
MKYLFVLIVFLIPNLVLAELPTYQLGAALALTGSAEAFGQQELKGAQLAISELESQGKMRLKLKVEDTASSANGTVTAVTKLMVIDGMQLIVGPTWLDSYQGAIDVAKRRGALLLSPSAVISVIKKAPSEAPLVFSTFFSLEREIEALMEHASRAGDTRIAILLDQDPYFQAMRRLVQSTARRFNLEVVFDQDFPSETHDFRSMLLKLRKLTPQRCIFGSAAQASTHAFLKQRRELYPTLPILGAHDFDGYGSDPAFATLLAGIEYVIPAGVSDSFKAAFKAKFGEEPIMTASSSYDAVMMIARALEQEKTTPDQIATFLKATTFATVSFGDARFSPWGGIENGQFVVKKW